MTEADPNVRGRRPQEQRGLRSNLATGESPGAGPEPRNRRSPEPGVTVLRLPKE